MMVGNGNVMVTMIVMVIMTVLVMVVMAMVVMTAINTHYRSIHPFHVP